MNRRDILKIMASATLLPLFSITKSTRDLIGKTFKDKIIEGGEFDNIMNCQFINCYFEKPLVCKTLMNCYFKDCRAETYGIDVNNGGCKVIYGRINGEFKFIYHQFSVL